MKAVSNASPLITLARIGRLEGLRVLFETVIVSREVYDEVVVAGKGLPGAEIVARASWIDQASLSDGNALAAASKLFRLGAGETSAVLLAKELGIPFVLMDERRGRRFARENGLTAIGCVGILEELYRRGEVEDLRGAYLDLLKANIRIETRTLESSLVHLGLPPL